MPISQLKIVKKFPPANNFFKKTDSGRRKRKIKISMSTILYVGLIVFLFGVIIVTGMFAWYSRNLPNPEKLITRAVEQSTKIYDRDGKILLYDIYNQEKRTLIELNQVPDFMKKATLSAEDTNFYQHGAFSFKAIARAIIVDIIKGGKAQGGSTITQQLVKNAILTNEKSFGRKIKELILAYQIEKRFSKDEILQMYLNEIPYGSVAYGVAAASQTFLGKDAKDLTLAQSAYLAALPKAPTYYSPYGSHVDALQGRAQYILDKMAEDGFITQEQAAVAKQEKVKFREKGATITAPHFVMFVKEYLNEKYGEALVESGLKVVTTLDLNMQKIAEEAVVNGVEARGKQFGFNNAALVGLDAKTGQILAMVGSKDFFDDEIDGQVNVVVRPRQPGSSIKPMVYGLGFSLGYQPETILFDVNTTFKTEVGDYTPSNYNLKEHGPVSIRQALAGSLNIPAVKMAYLAGVQNIADKLESIGYTTFADRSRFGLSIVLGGGEVKLLEHAAAFGAFAREGLYHAPVAILRVEDKNGNVLEEFKQKEKKVWEPEIARKVTSILSDNNARSFIFGAKNWLTLPDRPVVAKTGTTNDFHDAWAMGYTPSLVCGVWVGNNNNDAMKKGADGAAIAAPIWNEFMRRVTANFPIEGFAPYTMTKTNKPVLDGESPFAYKVKIDKYTGKLATDLTPANYVIEKQFFAGHDILHYVRRDDPLGSAPVDPAAYDWQYTNWEDGVQQWLKKNNIQLSSEPIPTEYDDVHTLENKPTIFINQPHNGEIIGGAYLVVNVQVSAPRGTVSRVEYYLDDKLIDTKNTWPFLLDYQISQFVAPGDHTLKAAVFDDVDNSNFVAIKIATTQSGSAVSSSWIYPKNQDKIVLAGSLVGLKYQIFDVGFIKKITFYSQKDGAAAIMISSIIAPASTIVDVNWSVDTGIGLYQVWPVIEDINGGIQLGEKISVELTK
ncbi:PBP1A family penicillin-binding protein [Candidatus Falkowbacteria bacterium]|nr:PBP1A family penicillin-binding protein [Candidatus Falkowbacteria bacterium]